MWLAIKAALVVIAVVFALVAVIVAAYAIREFRHATRDDEE